MFVLLGFLFGVLVGVLIGAGLAAYSIARGALAAIEDAFDDDAEDTE